MDIKFPIPDNADLVIENSKSKEELLSYAKPIIEKLLQSK